MNTLYSSCLTIMVPVATYYMLLASSGVSLVFNSLAIMHLLCMDEQLLAVLLPYGTAAAIRKEFRDARDALTVEHGWGKWKRLRAVKLEMAVFLCVWVVGSWVLHLFVVHGRGPEFYGYDVEDRRGVD